MKIREVLKQAKPCWKYAAMDKDFTWVLFEQRPYYDWECGYWNAPKGDLTVLSEIFDIEPFEGDWRDSLIAREE